MTYKIFVHSLPGNGHVNPIACLCERLTKEYKAQVYWYGTPTYREIIENSGAVFRELVEKDKDFMRPNLPPNKRIFPISKFIDILLRFIESNINQIADDIENEKPDLILADSMSIHFKWAWRLFEKRLKTSIQSNDLSFEKPKVIFFETSFAQQENNFQVMFGNFPLSEKILIVFRLIYASIKYRIKTLQYGLEYIFPFKDIFSTNPQMIKLVSTFPEFQPKSHLLGKNVKFIGPCIDDKIRPRAENSSLSAILEKFKERNPNFKQDGSEKLIYISMGTVFSNNLPLYIKFIEAIKLIEHSSTNKFKLSDLSFVISTGSTYNDLKSLQDSNELTIPPNVLLLPSVPQLDILKRASLFVTHCGMNSANEAVYYAVPMVAIPISADQPFVAHRVANELGFGVLLDYIEMTPDICKNAILEVLNDDSYHERIYRYSHLSRLSNGKIVGADFIINYLNRNIKKNKEI